jgi:hypothetical protein
MHSCNITAAKLRQTPPMRSLPASHSRVRVARLARQTQNNPTCGVADPNEKTEPKGCQRRYQLPLSFHTTIKPHGLHDIDRPPAALRSRRRFCLGQQGGFLQIRHWHLFEISRLSTYFRRHLQRLPHVLAAVCNCQSLYIP